MSVARQHAESLRLVDLSVSFLSVPAPREAIPQGLPHTVGDHRETLVPDLVREPLDEIAVFRSRGERPARAPRPYAPSSEAATRARASSWMRRRWSRPRKLSA